MKKKIVLLLCGISLFLCACGKETEGKGEQNVLEKAAVGQETSSQSIEGLSILCDASNFDTGYSTSSGYYYLTEESEKLNDAEYGMHLMYMDYATQQEVYLCSDAGCKHNTADCTAVFLEADFPSSSTRIFVYRDHLYVLSKEYDSDGSFTTNFTMGEDDVEIESDSVILYQMNLDGTKRQVYYTFEDDLMLEDFIIASDKGLYVITKKLSNESIANQTYTTSTERNLVFFDMENKTTEIICSMDFGDAIDWEVEGCYEHNLVLSGIDYGKELTAEDYMDDDVMKELYENSSKVIASLDIETGDLEEVYRVSNKKVHSDVVLDGVLYLSDEESEEIKAIDLTTREETTLCTLKQNFISDTLGNILCCRSWDMTADYTYYFVDTKTGEVHHSSLVNQSLGWPLELQADFGSQVLVIYDYEATSMGNDAYEITQYKYALISREDLLAGNANYQPIQMVGKGR